MKEACLLDIFHLNLFDRGRHWHLFIIFNVGLYVQLLCVVGLLHKCPSGM